MCMSHARRATLGAAAKQKSEFTALLALCIEQYSAMQCTVQNPSTVQSIYSANAEISFPRSFPRGPHSPRSLGGHVDVDERLGEKYC